MSITNDQVQLAQASSNAILEIGLRYVPDDVFTCTNRTVHPFQGTH